MLHCLTRTHAKALLGATAPNIIQRGGQVIVIRFGQRTLWFRREWISLDFGPVIIALFHSSPFGSGSGAESAAETV